jgi:hypothetical protein
MAGRPGRSGGHNKLSLAEHVLRGTVNVTRHLRTVSEAAPSAPWAPLSEDVATLGEAGRQWLTRWLQHFECTLHEGTLVLAAAHLLDDLAVWRLTAKSDPRAANLCISYTRTLASVLAQLRVR